MSQSKTTEVKKESSFSIPNILADFFLKKIDMAGHSDDSDLKHNSKRKKSKHKKRKHKKSKRHHHSSSFSSSSESSEVIVKGSIDGMSSSEEMDIKRLKKIKKVKFQAVAETVLKSSVSLPSQSEIRADAQTSSSSKENPVFYGPSLELLLSGVESNSFDSKSVPNNSCSGDTKLSGSNLNTPKISCKNDFSENVSKSPDVALPSSGMSSDSVADSINVKSASCANRNDCIADSKCENDGKRDKEATDSKCVNDHKSDKEASDSKCETDFVKGNSCKSDKEIIDSKCANDCEKRSSYKSDKEISSKGGFEESISEIKNRESDSNNQSLENECDKVPSSEKSSSNSGLANNEVPVKDASQKKSQDKSTDVKSKSNHRKHSRSRSRSKSRNRHASPKSKHAKRRSRSLSHDSHSARKKKRHSRSRSRSHDRVRSHDRKRRSYSKSRSRSRSKHSYHRNRRNSRSHSPHRRHGHRRIRSRSRSYSRSRKHSKSRTRRSRSKEHRRSLSKSKHTKSRKSRSRSRSRRSKSRSRRSKSRSRRSKSRSKRSRSRSKSRHKSPPKRKSHSRSNSTEKKSALHKSGKIDQAKILEMARKNVLKMMASGTMPEGLPVENLKKEQLISVQAGGKSVQELTDFCQRLSQKENESNASDNEDNGDKTEDERGFIHHPFKVKEPAMIKLNIKNAVQLPIKTHAQKVAELSSQFPVSSGNQHKKKELEWIPVVPETSKTETKPETTISTVASSKNAVVPLPVVTSTPILPPPPPPPLAISYPCPPPPEVPKVQESPSLSLVALPGAPVHSVVSQMQTAVPCPTIYQMSSEHVMQTYATPEQQMQYTAVSVPSSTFSAPSFPTFSTTSSTSVFKPPRKLDISSIVAKRFQAITKLQGNPNDPESLKILQDAQESIQEWVQSQQVPGLFTGSTDAKVLSAAELCGPYNKYHKSRKDFLSQAPPVTSGKGMSLLKKMGWNPGEGLGKNKEGSLEPLVLDIKTDKKGLVSEGENSKKGVSSFIKELQGKHPVSALMELCSKRKWKPPLYTCVVDTGPPHKKLFCFKVEVNGVEYQPVNPSSNKKIAKADSAVLCLQALNVLPKSV